ncbi:MAG: TVP38/TMEM64 family protein [Acidobacteriota bacterium]|nr:TVP38/TMEM64 family protein [Acidobacteriota bacterium]
MPRPRLLLALAFVAALLVAVRLLPFGDWVLRLAAVIRSTGLPGVALFIVIYVVSTVALLPGSILTLVAGFAWGPVWGLAVASPASVAGATAAFALGRTVLRGWVGRKLEAMPRGRAIDRAVGEKGFRLVLLLRLSPIVPFNLLNYALSLSDISIGRYVLASFVGMLPGTWLYVYLGSLATTAASLGTAGAGGGPVRLAFYAAGFAATVLVVITATRLARRALDGVLDDPAARP